MKAIKHNNFVGIHRCRPCKTRVVHGFDLDDTLTIKPADFNNAGLTKDQFFDASREFAPDKAITGLLRMLYRWGDAVAICTARPADRLTESWAWLRKWNIPFDCLLVSSGVECSGNTKQHMLKYLSSHYRMVGTLVDDSVYNIRGAAFQGVDGIHVLKNEEYWNAHPEEVVRV